MFVCGSALIDSVLTMRQGSRAEACVSLHVATADGALGFRRRADRESSREERSNMVFIGGSRCGVRRQENHHQPPPAAASHLSPSLLENEPTQVSQSECKHSLRHKTSPNTCETSQNVTQFLIVPFDIFYSYNRLNRVNADRC